MRIIYDALNEPAILIWDCHPSSS